MSPPPPASPLRHRDFLEQKLIALGDRVAPSDVPADLRWFTWHPCAQHLYVWSWAVRDGQLWGRLEDAYGTGGFWRVPICDRVRQALRAVARHLGPGVVLLAIRGHVACLGII